MIEVNLTRACFQEDHLVCKYHNGGRGHTDESGSYTCSCPCHDGGGWDTDRGSSNSSVEFGALTGAIYHDLRSGAAAGVLSDHWMHNQARMIAAHLAHVWGFAPVAVQLIANSHCDHHDNCTMNHTTVSSSQFCDHDENCDLDHG